MNKNNNISFAALVTVTACIMLAFFAGPALCMSETALMVHQSPVQGGQINIGTGVHYFGYGSQVNLIATPKPGYRFIYWLGDVSDETSNSTTAFLDNPKIIVAVYEREEFASLEERTFAVQTFSPPSQRMIPVRAESTSDISGDTKEDDPEDPPVPTPEPATVALLALGSMLVAKRKNRKTL